MSNYSADVTIMGGGLAGLSLALQIKLREPELDIIVVEKNQFPVPEAIAKVGESTVEIGSHYLANTLNLKQHLQEKHLRKFGIRCFFGEAQKDLSLQDELGSSTEFAVPTYQIDRGIIENHLAEQVKKMGVRLIDGTEIRNLCVDKEKTLQLTSGTITSKWLIDCAGRQSLLKTKLALQQNNTHDASAVWFRIDRRIEIDAWSSNAAWQSACQPEGKRWLSTNHLMGPGYWVWIIPLSSGVTSIGIVMDDITFKHADIIDSKSALAWLRKNQKKLFEEIEGAKFLDFAAAKNYSYSCRQIFSADQWAISGEAGFFVDPFYSPGTDFIAFANSFICDLISRKVRSKDIQFQSTIYQKIFYSFYENTLSIYEGQYGGFGDRKMMGLKILWDNSYYWGVLSLLFFQQSFTDTGFMRKHAATLQKMQSLNQTIQGLFRSRAAKRLVLPNRGGFMNLYTLPCLRGFTTTLAEQAQKKDPSQMAHNAEIVEQIAAYVRDILSNDNSRPISSQEAALFGDYRKMLAA